MSASPVVAASEHQERQRAGGHDPQPAGGQADLYPQLPQRRQRRRGVDAPHDEGPGQASLRPSAPPPGPRARQEYGHRWLVTVVQQPRQSESCQATCVCSWSDGERHIDYYYY